jgi:S-disulfanyl-L-cysteine oxidoreductase SoxD
MRQPIIAVALALLFGCRSEPPAQLGLGRPATDADIAPIDIDVNPAGAGLPAGQGTYPEGAQVYAAKCAACHGPHGEGIGSYPKLIGVDPQQDFSFGRDPKIPKTIGNYWPYATTIYDYVHRAMPLPAPGSLTPDETYALVEFLLAENGIVPQTAVMDAQTLPKVQMPARSHFVLDDRKGGHNFR